jgi:hypothetical protein
LKITLYLGLDQKDVLVLDTSLKIILFRNLSKYYWGSLDQTYPKNISLPILPPAPLNNEMEKQQKK